ncbi:hypothetical protein CH063_15357, partial [Colletotrichum higginsianum]
RCPATASTWTACLAVHHPRTFVAKVPITTRTGNFVPSLTPRPVLVSLCPCTCIHTYTWPPTPSVPWSSLRQSSQPLLISLFADRLAFTECLLQCTHTISLNTQPAAVPVCTLTKLFELLVVTPTDWTFKGGGYPVSVSSTLSMPHCSSRAAAPCDKDRPRPKKVSPDPLESSLIPLAALFHLRLLLCASRRSSQRSSWLERNAFAVVA